MVHIRYYLVYSVLYTQIGTYGNNRSVSLARATIPRERYTSQNICVCDFFYVANEQTIRLKSSKRTIMQSTVRPTNQPKHIHTSSARLDSQTAAAAIEAPVAAVRCAQCVLCSSSALSHTKSHTTGFSLSRIAIAAARGCYSQQ